MYVSNAKADFGQGFDSIDRPGGNLNGISRMELMAKLARTDRPPEMPKMAMQVVFSTRLRDSMFLVLMATSNRFRPNIPEATSKCM